MYNVQLIHSFHCFEFIELTLPYYFPTTSNGLLLKWGFKQPRGMGNTQGRHSTDLQDPIHPLEAEKPDSLPNIVVILIDSWNRRALTPECMPHTYQFAKQNQWYTNVVGLDEFRI